MLNRKSNISDYGLNVLVVYKEGSDSYKEVVQCYAQSLYIGTSVKAVSHKEFVLEKLTEYDLVYPDVSLVDADNRGEIVNSLIEYAKKGGNLFLEEDLYKMFPNDVLGMSEIVEVNLENQIFDFPIVPKKYDNLQKLWKIYSIKKRKTFYDAVRLVYHKFCRDYDTWVKSSNLQCYNIDLTKIDMKVHAIPDTALSLVNSNIYTLLSINKYGKGNVLWTINHIPKRGLYFGKPFITRLDLGYPDETAKNFHFGYATINYLMRNAYLDYIAKEKYGFSIQKVFGSYGRPSISWQNHLDNLEAWKRDMIIRWIDILREENQIPTFSLIRGTTLWKKSYGSVILNLNVGINSEPVFSNVGSDTPYLLSGTRLQKTDFTYIEVENLAHPFVVDWKEDGTKDLIVGAGDGRLYYYQDVGIKDKPIFTSEGTIKEGKRDLNVESNAAPFVIDWNEDGKNDLLVGAGNGKIYYYENTGTNRNPIFTCRGALKEGEKELNVGTNAVPFIVDWNEDGKNDLIVGAGDGNIYYYQNLGTNKEQKFLTKKVVRKSETDLHHIIVFVQNASPFVLDWDEDGKKDLVIGAAELHECYSINSNFFREDIYRNINYALKNNITIIPHYYVEYNYTPEQEFHELELHKKAFEDLGIPWNKTLGTNHHAWSVHRAPVWQTIHTEKDYGLIYDFGWNSMAADFAGFYCTTHPYMPYGMPFILTKNNNGMYSFIIWTPNTLEDYITCDGKRGLFVFPSSLDLPVTYYFHADERAFKYTKRHIFLKYLQSILKYGMIPTRLDLHSGEAYKVIRSFNKLRDEKEYNMMTEEQAAKALLNMYYTKVHVKIEQNKLMLIPDIENMPEVVQEYKNTLGIKIELHPDFKSEGITTDSSIYYKPMARQIHLGAYRETQVNLNEKSEDGIHMVRCNVPFDLNASRDSYEITVKSPGIRQFKLFSPHALEVKDEEMKIERRGKYYVVTDYGNIDKTISFYYRRSQSPDIRNKIERSEGR
jgi:hypothetical protein